MKRRSKVLRSYERPAASIRNVGPINMEVSMIEEFAPAERKASVRIERQII